MAQKLESASRTKKQIIMLKSILSTSLILLSVAGNAQSDKSKKVKTQYMQLPSYDVSATSPSSIGIEFAMNEISYGTEKLKDTKSKVFTDSKCVLSGVNLNERRKDLFMKK